MSFKDYSSQPPEIETLIQSIHEDLNEAFAKREPSQSSSANNTTTKIVNNNLKNRWNEENGKEPDLNY